jgi:hypothetical protein
MSSFFTSRIFLKIGKTQDLSNKTWQTDDDGFNFPDPRV